MIRLTFAERYAQARTYAAQVRVRKAMGDRYEHAKPWRKFKIAVTGGDRYLELSWRGPASLKTNHLTLRKQEHE